MSFTFENQGTNTYMVYEIAPTDMVDSMSLGMLTNNKINGLATTLFMQMDTTKYIKYNVSAKISVKQFFAGPVNKKRLIGVFTGIVDAMLSAEEYMIDPNMILLDLEYIFADVSTCETVLICLPIMNHEANNTDLGTFFKNIVFSTQFDQTENCDYVAKIINYLNSTPVFSLNDFSEILKSISKNENQSQVNVMQQSVPQPVEQEKKQSLFKQQKESQQVQSTPVQSQPVKPQPVQPQPVKPQPVQPQPVQPQPVQPQPVQPQPAQPQPVQPQPAPVQNQPFAIPGQQPMQQNQVPQPNDQNNQPAQGGEKMSMFYLLQHYNKENVAAYKAQKNTQKAGSTPNNAGMVKPEAKNAKAPSQPPKQGFAIPGQPAQPPMGAGQSNKPVTPMMGMVQTPNKQQVPPQAYNNFTQPQGTVSTPQPAPVQPASVPAQPIQTAPQGQAMNFGETTVLNAGVFGETTVLNAGMMQQEVKVQPYLIRSKNNERIELNKPVFRIGKEKSYVDYFISDNTAISRSHANVISRDGEYFVVDTNSTNHTYVNGMMIQSNVETKIDDGAKIRLANEEFEFKLK